MKPSLPQGTRDFGIQEMRKRQYIIETIRRNFELYGYQALETPALENLNTLMGKYGDEGDRLLFKVLNNGLNHPSKEKQVREGFDKILSGKNSTDITERALRYDLTIPFARYVAMNHQQLPFPFKRYQIQPVWRADRPQRGRYREFYQCDADVVGSNALINEVELVQIYDQTFAQLGIRASIAVNNRKILFGMAQVAGCPEKLTDLTIAIDKLDKIGKSGVLQELTEKGIDTKAQAIIEQFLVLQGQPEYVLNILYELLATSEIGLKGIAELQQVFAYLHQQPLVNEVKIDLTLARGLDYYTGCIFEAKALDVQMGSIGGGGRYDDLTGTFGLKGMSGVGISFGLDRIFDVMQELGLLDKANESNGTRLLFVNFGEQCEQYAFACADKLRKAGIAVEIYPEKAKLDKQLKYANAKHIPFVAFVGEEEISNQTIKLKNMDTRQELTASAGDLIGLLDIL